MNIAACCLAPIVRDTCQDTMSGVFFPYQVRISIKTGTMSEPIEFTGCGQYLGDYRLNDIWMLESLDGKKVEIAEGNQRPSMELHLKDKRIMGLAGCNWFTGSVSFHQNEMAVGLLAATRMASPDISLEDALLAALSDHSYSYRILGTKLILHHASHQLIFQKTD